MNSKKLSSVISTILILFLALGILGFIAYLATGGDTYSFYVVCEDKEVYTNSGGFVMEQESGLEVKVKYLDSNKSGYTVKVVPTKMPGKNFDFSHNGDIYSFQSETDLTAGFDIEQKEDSFVIKPKGDIVAILSCVYPNAEIECPDATTYDNMFTLIVTDYEGKSSVTINFEVRVPAAGIKLDKEVIVF